MSEPSGLGRFDGKVHILPIRIYYEDTDLSGVVYHANYLRYMERGRTEFFRLAGVTNGDARGCGTDGLDIAQRLARLL